MTTVYLFDGEEGVRYDPTGQYQMGWRVMDPDLARFLSADPLWIDGTSDDPSKYPFAGNNPVNWSDPSGLFTQAELNKAEELIELTKHVLGEGVVTLARVLAVAAGVGVGIVGGLLDAVIFLLAFLGSCGVANTAPNPGKLPCAIDHPGVEPPGSYGHDFHFFGHDAALVAIKAHFVRAWASQIGNLPILNWKEDLKPFTDGHCLGHKGHYNVSAYFKTTGGKTFAGSISCCPVCQNLDYGSFYYEECGVKVNDPPHVRYWI